MRVLKWSLSIVLLLAILYVAAIFTIEFYIEKQLKKEKQLSYKEFNMTFGGDIAFKNLQFKNDSIDVQVEDINLNIGIMKILMADTILIEKATVKQVKLTKIKQVVDSSKVDSTKMNQPKEKRKRAFALKNVDITGFDFYSIEKEDTLMRLLGVDVQAKLKDIKNIQFNQLEKLSFQSLRYKVGVLNDITIDHFDYSNHTVLIDTFKMFTRYSKAEYIKHIPQRKGHIDLVAYKLILDSVDFKIQKNKLERISLNEINLEKFALDVYRDKTIPEYTKLEPTYAQIMQDLPFEIDVKEVIAKKSRLSFSMKSDDGRVSRIDLKDINGRLKHLNNIPSKKQIFNLTGDFSFNPKSNIGIYLSYNQYAKVEDFQLDLHGKNIDTRSLNPMFRPAMNAELNGIVSSIDAHMVSMGTGNGTVRIQSDDLIMTLYKHDGKKRVFVSAIGNLFLHKPLDKTGKVKDFEFDKTRPIWNYMWHFIEAGIKKAII